MTFTDVIQRSSKFLSVNKKDSHRKLKRLNKSIIKLFPPQQQASQTHSIEHQSTENSSLHPPSDLSRTISNRSITFASVFDDQFPTHSNDSPECEDLIIVVPNKFVLDEPTIAEVKTEPYPFRTELPSCVLKTSSSTTHLNRSERKNFHFLIHPHRPKKLHHPVKINSIDRSKSSPNLLFSSSTSITTDQHHRSLNIIRHWFSSSSLGRFIQSLTKQHSKKSHPTIKSIPSVTANVLDLIY